MTLTSHLFFLITTYTQSLWSASLIPFACLDIPVFLLHILLTLYMNQLTTADEIQALQLALYNTLLSAILFIWNSDKIKNGIDVFYYFLLTSTKCVDYFVLYLTLRAKGLK